MKIKGLITEKGPFIPIFVLCKELNISYPILFLIDTGADTTTISASDLRNQFDYTKLEKANDVVGIGGIQECYILHNVALLFFTSKRKVIGEKLETITFLPPIYNENLRFQIPISSLLGRDIIGKKFELKFSNNEVYLKR